MGMLFIPKQRVNDERDAEWVRVSCGKQARLRLTKVKLFPPNDWLERTAWGGKGQPVRDQSRQMWKYRHRVIPRVWNWAFK